jgi:hypothetical protein
VAEVADLTSTKQKSCRTWLRFPKRPQGSSVPQAQPTLEGRAPDPTNRREIVIEVPRLRLDSHRRRQNRAHLPRRDGQPADRRGVRPTWPGVGQGKQRRSRVGSRGAPSAVLALEAAAPSPRTGAWAVEVRGLNPLSSATFRDKPLTPQTIMSASSSSDDGVHGSSAAPSPPLLSPAITNVPNTGLRARLTVGTRCSKV